MAAVSLAALPRLPRSVLAVVAHPDDESFGLGGIIAAFVAAGSRVGLVCFTHGERSTLGGGDLFTLRAQELSAAATVLGMSWCRLLSHPDGQLAAQPTDVFASEVEDAARETGAELLLAFDDEGVTGHPDHKAATAAAVAAGRRLGLPVLGWVVTPALAEQLNAELGTSFAGRTPDLVVQVDRARQRRAVAAHRSQAEGNAVLERRLTLSGDTEALRWLVAPTPQDPGEARLVARARELGASEAEIAAAVLNSALGALVLDVATRAGERTVPFEEGAAAAGLGTEAAARIWRAFGFPDPAAFPRPLTTDEIAALRLVGTLGSRLLGDETALMVARVAGTAVAGIAETVVDAFRAQFEVPRLRSGTPYPDVVEEYVEAARELLPEFVIALGALVRAHIIDVASGRWSVDVESATARRDLAVGFADLAGYTPLTRSLRPAELAGLVSRFEEAVAEAAAREGGRVVKLIGDGAMYTADDSAAACRIALGILVGAGERSLPPVRVGIDAGSVVALHGDYFGEPVNRAARLLGVARPGEIAVSAFVRAQAGEIDGARFVRLGRRRLKGFGSPQAVFVLRPVKPVL